MFARMTDRGWHLRRLDDGTTVWEHPAYSDVRIEPSPWLDETGREWPGGVSVVALDSGGGWAPGPTFYWVHQAMNFVETSSTGAPPGSP